MGLGAEKDSDIVLHFNDPFDNPALPKLSTAQPGSLINNTLARQTPLKRGTKHWIGTGKPYWQNKRFSSENNADVWMGGENSQPNRSGENTNKQIIKIMKDCTPITKMECSVNW
jgi:hypothetical protein